MADRFFVTDQQKRVLIEYMREHEDLRKGLFSATFTRQVSQNLWEQITATLNDIQGGSRKDWKKWRKTWQDLKKNAISKRGRNKRAMTGTGGGPPRIELISDLEEQILGLVPIECVEGQQEVSESTVDFQFNPANVEPDTNDEVVEEIIEVQPGPSTFLLQKKEESILDIKLLEDAGIETAPINDHNYSVRRGIKRKIRKTGSTKISRLNEAQKQSEKLLQKAEEQAKETREYRTQLLNVLKGIHEELREIKMTLKKE